MSNRVEELETKVAELQAAVDGLTEELVETRERLRQLESANDVEVARAETRTQRADDAAGADGEGDKADETESEDEAETSEGEDEDIIVA
ncbi:MAG: chromosome segregation protein SMC [Haloferacaceae archaeon]